MPTMAQYKANHFNLAFFTKAIITLQAKSPDIKAETNPRQSGNAPTVEDDISPPAKLKIASPKMGIITIRKEN